MRHDLDFLPSASDLRILGKMNPMNFGNSQPRVGIAYAFRNGKGVVRSSFGLYTGSLEYSSLINGWHGASPFTHMKQPLLPEFANPENELTGFGPAGMVGTAGPVLAGPAFSNFTHTGTYPHPAILKQFPLGFVKRNYPSNYAEQANLEVENELGNRWYLTVGCHYLHALHLESSNSINAVPNGILSDGRQKFTPADYERLKLNLSAEALNLLNRVNVQDVDQVYGAGEFAGSIPKAFGTVLPARTIRLLALQRLPEPRGSFSYLQG